MLKFVLIDKKGRAVLCMLKTSVHDHQIYLIKLEELRHLLKTLGVKVVKDFVQSRHRSFAKYHIGSGKVKEIQRYIQKHDIDLVVFYNILKSSQKLNLIRALNCDVLDRYEITLEIFDQMASDNLSKLQIESARLEKLAPYFKLGAKLRYHNDRPFFRSMGEYAFHSQLREITRRQARIRKRIETLTKEKRQRIKKRKNLGFPTICISGYYNAGKTSLFNALTGENKLVSNLPFTTLSSKYQRRYVDNETTILFIDTIGFVIDLDPRLIKSFELNLEDMRSADLIILLLEITDTILTIRIKLAEGIRLLRGLDIPRERIILVFNKMDLAPNLVDILTKELELERYGLPWTVISAQERINLEELLQILTQRLKTLYKPQVNFDEREKINSISNAII